MPYTSPLVVFKIPQSMLMRVDFPAPLWPRMQVMSLTALKLPNCLIRFLTSMTFLLVRFLISWESISEPEMISSIFGLVFDFLRQKSGCLERPFSFGSTFSR